MATGGRYKCCVSVRNHHSLLEENKMELFDSSIFALSIIQGRDGGGSGSGGLPVCTTDASAAAGRAEVAGTTGRHCDAMPVPPPLTAPHHPLSALLRSRLCFHLIVQPAISRISVLITTRESVQVWLKEKCRKGSSKRTTGVVLEGMWSMESSRARALHHGRPRALL